MKYHLKAPIIFERTKQIDCFCLPLNARLSNKDTLIIDLSSVGFIKPMGVIGILLFVESITKMSENKRPDIQLIAPANAKVLDYLLTVNFITALQSLCTWEISDEIKGSGHKIKPVITITRFHTLQDVDNIAIAMQNTFHTEFVGLSTLLQPCDVVFSELAHNAVEHANSDGGFVLAQQYDYSSGSKLEIAVGDCGIGIPKSLKQNAKGKFDTDQQAVTLVLQGGLSRTNDPYRGYGLYQMKEELIRVPDRSLTLRSGNGYAIIHSGGRNHSAECAYFPGTIGHAVIPCG